MRLSLAALLLLGTAVPAVAQDPDPQPVQEAQAAPAPEPEPRRDTPPVRHRAEESPRVMRGDGGGERAMPRFDPPPPPPVMVSAPTAESTRAAPDRSRGNAWREQARTEVEERRSERQRDWVRPTDVEAPRPAATDSVSGWQYERRDAARRARQDREGAIQVPPPREEPRRIPVVGQAPQSPEPIRVRPVPGAITPPGYEQRGERVDRPGWRDDWRRDRRYDWRRQRDRDRGRFHVSVYIDPFGWNYRPYQIGWRLPSRFYSARYWIQDPWYYRLPPVSGPYRWIRYYNDVLLVDLRTGRVLDTIPRFFW
ncbi:hypothetical protein GCM10022281_05950 [Sphingomonas rosea]|uniref:Nickel/cobalt transporter regulator n=1 Tax=Sphingomonas rosea TaxID=335605 RepID=A0ABP7TPY1_9SPHN